MSASASAVRTASTEERVALWWAALAELFVALKLENGSPSSAASDSHSDRVCCSARNSGRNPENEPQCHNATAQLSHSR